jgi:hypothetical protein
MGTRYGGQVGEVGKGTSQRVQFAVVAQFAPVRRAVEQNVAQVGVARRVAGEGDEGAMPVPVPTIRIWRVCALEMVKFPTKRFPSWMRSPASRAQTRESWSLRHVRHEELELVDAVAGDAME